MTEDLVSIKRSIIYNVCLMIVRVRSQSSGLTLLQADSEIAHEVMVLSETVAFLCCRCQIGRQTAIFKSPSLLY